MKIVNQITLSLGVLATACVVSSCNNEYDAAADSYAEVLDQKVQEYSKNFVSRYGEPDPNHTWGFSAPTTKTRAANANGNEWYDTYEIDPNVTTEEKNAVLAYVNKDASSVKTTTIANWTTYFVSQVYRGEDLTTTYPDQNGSTKTIKGRDKMDQLEAQLADGTWEHINNFNNTSSGGTYDYKGTPVTEKMLMVDSGTKSFRYNNSDGSLKSEKFIVVSGADIFGASSPYAGYYYVCFDFEYGYTDAEKAAEVTNTTINGSYDKKVVLAGSEAKVATCKITMPDYYNGSTDSEALINALNNDYVWLIGNAGLGIYNEYKGGSVTGVEIVSESPLVVNATWTVPATGGESWETVNVNNENFNPSGFYTAEELTPAKVLELKGETAEVRNVNIAVNLKGYQNGDKHCDGDNVYTDWIVRISPATMKSDYTLRVMCEDLGNTNDFDFNDVVFDATWLGGNQVKIQLKAAGGILPIRVGGADANVIEAHAAFKDAQGNPVPNNRPVNVGAGWDNLTAEAYTVTVEGSYSEQNWWEAIKAVPIHVNNGGNVYALEVSTNNYNVDKTNKAPQYFAVPTTVEWPRENQQIEKKYPKFPDWVKNQNAKFWE